MPNGIGGELGCDQDRVVGERALARQRGDRGPRAPDLGGLGGEGAGVSARARRRGCSRDGPLLAFPADTWTIFAERVKASAWIWLEGGKDNFPADRAAAERVLQVMPSMPLVARFARLFLARSWPPPPAPWTCPRSVGVLLIAVLHFIPDADDPFQVVARLMDAMPLEMTAPVRTGRAPSFSRTKPVRPPAPAASLGGQV